MEKPWKNPRFLLVTPWPLRRLVHGVWAMIVSGCGGWRKTLLVWRWWPMRWGLGMVGNLRVGSLANGSLISRMVSYNLQLCSFPLAVWLQCRCWMSQTSMVTLKPRAFPSILALTLSPPSPVTSTFWIVLDRASGSPSNSLFFVYFPGSMLV